MGGLIGCVLMWDSEGGSMGWAIMKGVLMGCVEAVNSNITESRGGGGSPVDTLH